MRIIFRTLVRACHCEHRRCVAIRNTLRETDSRGRKRPRNDTKGFVGAITDRSRTVQCSFGGSEPRPTRSTEGAANNSPFSILNSPLSTLHSQLSTLHSLSCHSEGGANHSHFYIYINTACASRKKNFINSHRLDKFDNLRSTNCTKCRFPL